MDAPPPLADTPSSPLKKWYRSKWFHLAIGLVVTFACLAWALHVMAGEKSVAQVMTEIGGAFRQANYFTLLPMWGALFLFYWIKAWRWRMLLAPLGDYPVSRLFPPTLIGFAFNNVLPAHLGEFVRVFAFSRQSGQPKTAILTTLVLERVFDVLAILAFLSLGLLFVPNMDPGVRTAAYYAAGFVSVALLGAAAYLIWTKPFVALFEWTLDRIPLLPTGLKSSLTQLVETGAVGLASLKSGPLLGGIVLTSLVQWGLNGAMIWLSLWSFGFTFSPLVAFLVLGVTAFGVTVPSSPGYFGIIQVCFLAVLGLFTTPDEKPAIMAASIYYHMAQWVPVTLIGMFYFLRSGLHVADIEQQQTDAV